MCRGNDQSKVCSPLFLLASSSSVRILNNNTPRDYNILHENEKWHGFSYLWTQLLQMKSTVMTHQGTHLYVKIRRTFHICNLNVFEWNN